MRSQSLHGRLVGTFEGKAGDQFQQAIGKVDLMVGETTVDPETGEKSVEIIMRAEQPVDEQRIHLELPEHGKDKFIEELTRAFSQ